MLTIQAELRKIHTGLIQAQRDLPDITSRAIMKTIDQIYLPRLKNVMRNPGDYDLDWDPDMEDVPIPWTGRFEKSLNIMSSQRSSFDGSNVTVSVSGNDYILNIEEGALPDDITSREPLRSWIATKWAAQRGLTKASVEANGMKWDQFINEMTLEIRANIKSHGGVRRRPTIEESFEMVEDLMAHGAMSEISIEVRRRIG